MTTERPYPEISEAFSASMAALTNKAADRAINLSGSDIERQTLARAQNAEHRVMTLLALFDRVSREHVHRVAAEGTPGDHNYHGPTKDGKAVPDEVHERFHKSIGDVLAGNVMPAARRQMREALEKAPQEKTPFPTASDSSDRRRIGWRVPT